MNSSILWTIMVVFCCISLLLAWVMVYTESKDKHLITFLLKVIASVFFVGAGILACMFTNGDRPRILLLLAGLVLGLLGDIFLCRKHYAQEEYWDIFLNVGGAFFLIGHLCYFFVFIQLGALQHFEEYVIVLILIAFIYYLMKSQFWKIPKKDWISYIGYAFISGLMLSGGIEVFLVHQGIDQFILASAAIVFIFSDLFLATWNFSKFHNVTMRYICISLYYIAQILFVFGIAFS